MKSSPSIDVKPYSYAAAAGFGAIWVTNTGRPRSTENGSVQRVDPKTNTVVATIPSAVNRDFSPSARVPCGF